MKSKLLLLSILGLSAGLSAQSNMKHSMHQKLTNIANRNTIGGVNQEPSVANITLGDTLYSNDFSDSLLFVKTNTPGSYWVFGTDATIGNGFLADPFASTTSANGYAMFDSDGFGPAAINDASITTGPIDLTAVTGDIALNFEQYYARFNDVASVQISTDNITFTSVGDNSDVPMLTQASGSETANPVLKTILISSYVGQTIYVRFNFQGNWDYSWLVDDLTITTATVEPYDLTATSAVNCDILTQYSYAQTPLTQVQPVGFTILLRNNGSASQIYTVNYEIVQGATVVNTGSTTSTEAVAGFTSDTLNFVTAYTPTAVGDYTINLTLTSDATDFNPADNTTSTTFSVTDFLMSPIGSTLSTTATAPFTLSGTGPAPDYNANKVGQSFFINANQTLNSMQVGIFKPTGFSGEQSFVIEFYEIDPATGRPMTDVMSISDYVMTTSHSNTTWKTIIFDNPISLEAGKTYVAAVSYELSDKVFAISGLGDEDLDNGTWGYGPFGASSAINWFVGFSFSPAIRLNFDPTVGINDLANKTSNISVYPNPANNVVRIAMPLSTPEAYSVRMLDINGRVVFNKSQSKSTSVSETISLDQLAGGVYTLQVSTASGVSTSKVVVSH
jgi:hypothetical protein